MQELTFKAIGTKWCISVDAVVLEDDTRNDITEYVTDFEKRFSRFLPDSEVNAYRSAVAGEYKISMDLVTLLSKAQHLRTLTGGVYDPAVGELLERAGYNREYSMKPHENIDAFVLPKWTLKEERLVLKGPTAFDLGGIGKGYCIDQVAKILKDKGHRNFVVDAGGDMYVTSKKDGSPWRVAIQYPGRPDTAAGVVDLQGEALAVSDSFRRRWGKWHHLVHPELKRSVENVIGAAAVAPSAWHADCMTSALFLSSSDAYPKAAREYRASYLVFHRDGTCVVSKNWQGELF